MDNGMVVLFSSRDAQPDEVDDVSLCLECCRSGLTRVTVQVGKCCRCSHLVYAQHRGSCLVSESDNVPIVDAGLI